MKKLLSALTILAISSTAIAQETDKPKLLQEYNAIEFGPSAYFGGNNNELDNKIHVEFLRSITDEFYFQLGFSTANSQGADKFSLNALYYGVGFTDITDFGTGEIDTSIAFNLMNIQDTQTNFDTDETTTTNYMGQKISVGINTLMNTMPQIVTKLAVHLNNSEPDGFNVFYDVGVGYDFNRYLQLNVNVVIGPDNNSNAGIAIRRKF